jgi:hypothetical protein
MSRTDSRGKWHAVAAGYLGWTMDAFDFFVVIGKTPGAISKVCDVRSGPASSTG